MTEISYDYFNIDDGNAMTIEQRIRNILPYLPISIIENGTICRNEQDIREAINAYRD